MIRIWSVAYKRKGKKNTQAPHPGKFLPEGYTLDVSPRNIPRNKAWLCEICSWREPVPTRVLNPNASDVSYKPKQRSYKPENIRFFRGEYTAVERSGGNFPGSQSHPPSLLPFRSIFVMQFSEKKILKEYWFVRSPPHFLFYMCSTEYYGVLLE